MGHSNTNIEKNKATRKTKNSDMDTKMRKVWVEYKVSNSTEARNQLIEAYMPIVKFHADRVAAKVGVGTQSDELIAPGVFGMMDALDAFELDRGIKFTTFAAHRVRGAILDELRSMDWVPRLVRSRTAKYEDAKEQLSVELGREPNNEEIKDKLGVNKKDFKKINRDNGITGIVSLQQQMGDQSNGDRELDAERILADTKQADPSDEAQRIEMREMILEKLNRMERLLITLYYYEGMTMREISHTFQISESRVCQMHGQILKKLKTLTERFSLEPRVAC